MHRVDNSRFLLYIEPPLVEKLEEPIQDIYTKIMRYALDHAQKGVGDYGDRGRKEFSIYGGPWMGLHTTACGRHSDCWDFLLENGMITNSLAEFYLEWYRDSIPESEMNKVKELAKFYSEV